MCLILGHQVRPSPGVLKLWCAKACVRACVRAHLLPYCMCSFSHHCRIWDISSQRKRHGGFFRRVGGTHRIPSCARTNWSLSNSRCGVCRPGWSSLYIRWEVMRDVLLTWLCWGNLLCHWASLVLSSTGDSGRAAAGTQAGVCLGGWVDRCVCRPVLFYTL